jgi:Toprim-like/CHC2 zinc finger
MGFRNSYGLPSCAEINRLDIVDFLATIGHLPKKIRGINFWYLSPFRIEKTPSFKVDRKLNCWYDFATREGYSLIDFGVRYYDITIKELLIRLVDPFFSSLNVPHLEYPQEAVQTGAIEILEIGQIKSSELIHYLQARRLDLRVAQKFCKEATYQVGKKIYYSICFENNLGGYELRNKYFKGSSSPKASSFFDNGSNEITVFEGFFDFLSFLTIFKELPIPTNYLVLNSLSFFESNYPVMELHSSVHLYLDRDHQGQTWTKQAIARSQVYTDESGLYEGYKDLNDWLCLVGHKGNYKVLAGL